MDPPPSPPYSPIDFNIDFFDETANFDFDTCFNDSLLSPAGTTMPHCNNDSSFSPPIRPSDHLDPHLLHSNAVSVDNFCSALADQIQVSTGSQAHPINYQSLQGIPKELVVPQMMNASPAHDPINNYQSMPVHQQIIPSHFSNPNQLPKPPLPHFAGQTAAVNYQPSSYSALEGQLPREEYTPPPPKSTTVSSVDNFVGTMDEILSHDPEAIACFLAGIVRPGPGCSIYKCSTCSVEFPNAQAFGGHMKSHAKRKAEEEGDGKGKGKRMRGSASSKRERTKAWKKKSCESEEDD